MPNVLGPADFKRPGRSRIFGKWLLDDELRLLEDFFLEWIYRGQNYYWSTSH
jgi:hypothetical protein